MIDRSELGRLETLERRSARFCSTSYLVQLARGEQDSFLAIRFPELYEAREAWQIPLRLFMYATLLAAIPRSYSKAMTSDAKLSKGLSKMSSGWTKNRVWTSIRNVCSVR